MEWYGKSLHLCKPDRWQPAVVKLIDHDSQVLSERCSMIVVTTQIARFMGSTWDPPGADRTQVGPMLAPWTLLSGKARKYGHGHKVKKYVKFYPLFCSPHSSNYSAVPLQRGQFCPISLQLRPHSLPVSFKSDLRYATVIAVRCVIPWKIGPQL